MAPNDLETLRVAIRDELNQWREQRPGNEQDARPANELLADLHLAMTEERDEGRNAVARVQALLHRRSRNDDPLGNNDPDPDARPPTVEGTRHPLGDTETESVCPEPTGDRSASSVERRRPRPPRTGATGANQATGQGQSTGTNQANNNGDGNGDGDDDDGDYPDNNAMLTELLEQSDGEIKQAFPSSGQFCDQCGKSWRGNVSVYSPPFPSKSYADIH